MRLRPALALFLAGFAISAGLAAQTPEPTPTPPSAPQPPTPDPNRITFELPLGEERGGGKIAGAADRLETVGENEAMLEGSVEIRLRDLTFRAERVVLHRDSMTLEAEGDVVFDQGPRRIAASRVDFDLATRTGTFWNAAAYVEPDYYFSGAVVAKTGDQTYEIRDGVFTSCTGDPTPDWSLKTSRADVEIGGYAHVRNARVRIKKMPILYWPYMIWPAKPDRTSGLLIPNIGYSQQRGAYLGLAYYQVLGPSADATLFLDGYAEGFAGAGTEVRWRPSGGSQGKSTFYLLRDSDRDEVEWRGRFEHTSNDLPFGLRGLVSFEDYSDFEFFRQFERAESVNTRRFLYSNAFLSGTWGAQSLNLLVDQRETFLGLDASTTQSQLPEVAYRLTKLKLGESNFYLSLDSTASYLKTETPTTGEVGYGRFDLAPKLTLPLRVAPWLSLALSAGGRATWWGESLAESRVDPVTGTVDFFCGEDPADPDRPYCGEAIDRVYPALGVDLIGPSVSRVFEKPLGRFSKFKHLIEPRWSYSYLGDFEEQQRVPRFDEIDPFASSHNGTFALVNRVLAKPSDATEGGAFEILSFELAQGFSFDRDQPFQRSSDGSQTASEGPISARLNVNPSREVSFQARALWSTLFGSLSSTSISARADLGRLDVDLTWFTDYNAELDLTSSDQARLGLTIDVLPQRLSVSSHVSYDLESSEIQQQRYFLSWTSQCWSALIEVREQSTRAFTSRDYRFVLNLKNVGSFLDLTSGDSTGTSGIY